MTTAEILRDADATQAAPADAMEFPRQASIPTLEPVVVTPRGVPSPDGPPPGFASPSTPRAGLPGIEEIAMRLYGPGGAREREAEQMRIRAAAMRPEYANVRDAAAQQERIAAAIPRPPVLAAPPSRGLREFLAVSENESPVASVGKLVQALGLFATMMHGATRQNAVGALAALNGAMTGWAVGDAERADAAFKDWQAQSERALKNYELQRTAYNDALTASGKNFDARVKLAQLKALELGDTQAVLAFESGSLDKMLDFLTKRDDAATKFENERLKAEAAYLKALQERRPGTIAERYALAQRRAKENPADPQAQAEWADAQAAMEQQIRLEREKGAAAALGAQGVALTPKQAEGLIHPRTLAGPPPGMTMAQAIANGYVETDEKDRGVIADLQQTKAIVGTLSAMTAKLITATTPSEALAQKARLEAGARTGSDPLARTYEQTVSSFLGTVSRSLAGERGVLTNQDLARIKAAFPGFFDTKAVAEAKVGLLNLLIETAYQARVAKMTKQPIDDTKLRASIDTLITNLERQGTTAPVERVPVVGPNGEAGTVPKGTTLPPGWRLK